MPFLHPSPLENHGVHPQGSILRLFAFTSPTSTANRQSLPHQYCRRRQACIRITAAVELASTPLPAVSMEPWCRSNITSQHLEGLVRRGLLRPLSAFMKWLLPGDEDEPSLPEGYVVSFALFHERGFAVPAHTLLRGLLDYYKVELQHLNPNGI